MTKEENKTCWLCGGEKWLIRKDDEFVGYHGFGNEQSVRDRYNEHDAETNHDIRPCPKCDLDKRIIEDEYPISLLQNKCRGKKCRCTEPVSPRGCWLCRGHGQVKEHTCPACAIRQHDKIWNVHAPKGFVYD